MKFEKYYINDVKQMLSPTIICIKYDIIILYAIITNLTFLFFKKINQEILNYREMNKCFLLLMDCLLGRRIQYYFNIDRNEGP